MSNYKILDLDNKVEWNDYLERFPDSQKDVYYTPEYYSLYDNLGDGKAQCFLFKKDKHLILFPFLKNSINILGYELDNEYFDIQGAYGYNGLITTTDDELFFRDFYHSFDEYCIENNIVAEFNRYHPLNKNQLYSTEFRQVFFDRKTIPVKLDNVDDKMYSSSTRRGIKKAIKNGLITKVYKGEDIQTVRFKELYRQTMERVNSSKYLWFNEQYFTELLQLNNVEQLTVELQGKIVASAICFYSSSYYHYHLGASDAEYLNMRPNNLLFDQMIKQASEKGCDYLHLGGGTSNDPDDGLFKFKSGFSNIEADFFIGKKIHILEVYNNVKEQWSHKYPESFEKYGNRVLGYREI